ncbi:XRE family transcriptional regulator [Fusobacterium ulcerans]|uniref:XRE family transcriptional regulator n=1 Tax=Fusobacterium ulcerans TaxID=861 RepID=UPI002E7A10E3|nr:XRE family transcriptional regulator [Fusobacterium ulcerans]MEE0137993.1 XRE family transcriptional regulator [Fusobacterium ulcerans]
MEKIFELSEEKALELGKLLKNKREKLGYTSSYIETRTGIDKADLSRIENGKKKKINPIYLKELSNILEINQLELFNLAGFIDDIYLKNNLDITTLKPVKLIEVPLFANVSAGLGCEAISDPVDYIMIPEEHGDIISIIVKGDSMEDTIFDGAIVIVRRDLFPEVGEIGVFLTNDTEYPDGLVKRLRNKNGKYILESDNKKYKDIVLKNDEVRTCGKVINILNNTSRREKDPIITSLEKLDAEEREMIEKLIKNLARKNK